MTVEEIITDLLSYDMPLGLATLKACVLEHQKQLVEPAVTEMVAAGLVIEIRKHRYVRARGDTR